MTLSAPEEGQPPIRTVGGARCHTVDRLRRYLLRVAPVGVWPGHVLTGLRRPADRTFEVRSHEGSDLRICLRSRHPASVERPSLDRSAGSDTGERRRHRLERGAVGERLWRARPPCRVRWRPGRSPPRPGEGRATRAKPISGSGTEGRDRAWCRACRRAREGRCPTVRWTARRTVRSALAQPPRAPRPRPAAATAAKRCGVDGVGPGLQQWRVQRLPVGVGQLDRQRHLRHHPCQDRTAARTPEHRQAVSSRGRSQAPCIPPNRRTGGQGVLRRRRVTRGRSAGRQAPLLLDLNVRCRPDRVSWSGSGRCL